MLREFIHDAFALRRGEHRGARLKMQQERLERLANENFPWEFNLAHPTNPPTH